MDIRGQGCVVECVYNVELSYSICFTYIAYKGLYGMNGLNLWTSVQVRSTIGPC